MGWFRRMSSASLRHAAPRRCPSCTTTIQGWIKTEFDGEGAIVMQAGSCWIQPPRIKHKVLDYSDDCEVLEIILPADFKTVELE